MATSSALSVAKQQSLRCSVCRARLGAIPFTCRCERHFCARHRTGLRQQVYGSAVQSAERNGHLCDFDHVAVHNARLQTQMRREKEPFFP